MLILAVDPGLSGAVAFLGDHWCKVLDVPTVPLEGDGGISRRVHGPALQQLVMENIPEGEEEVHAVMELLSPGGQNNRVQTSISQGRTVGTIECLLECLGLEVHRVYAQTWKRIYGLVGKKAEGENPEKKAREIATTLYPSLGMDLQRACDHNRAEAVLIGHWYRKCRL
jgi:hypothetical protein